MITVGYRNLRYTRTKASECTITVSEGEVRDGNEKRD